LEYLLGGKLLPLKYFLEENIFSSVECKTSSYIFHSFTSSNNREVFPGKCCLVQTPEIIQIMQAIRKCVITKNLSKIYLPGNIRECSPR